MENEVTAIFDIGKTNKKFFLFNKDFKEVYREYIRLEEIEDEDGFPTENIEALQNWVIELFNRIIESKKFKIKALNFTTYGASLVHIDANGKVLTPLYNYTKPLDGEIVQSFYKKYGPIEEFAKKTGSSGSGMLISGMQLYWLKHKKPEIFNKVKYSLHFPQYLSYIFTRKPLSEYTSIGCHTALWDYEKNDYHHWVYNEEIHKILPPIVSAETCLNMSYKNKLLKIGVGIHDSSAALLPYIRNVKKPFVLVSTGTWSITLNPFIEKTLTEKDIQENCINYMRINGEAIKSSRMFLGNEYKYQVKELSKYYNVSEDHHKSIKFNKDIFSEIRRTFVPIYNWESLKVKNLPSKTEINYSSYDYAYHHLMMELVLLQVKSIKTAMDGDKIKRIYIEGGFSDNEVYIKLLSFYLNNLVLRTTNSSLGSALGAAMVISNSKLNPKFLKKNYGLKKHVAVAF